MLEFILNQIHNIPTTSFIVIFIASVLSLASAISGLMFYEKLESKFKDNIKKSIIISNLCISLVIVVLLVVYLINTKIFN